MFLWELKNGIISQNLCELCDIKTNTKNPHTVASTTLSHQTFYYTLLDFVEDTTFLDLPQNIEPTTIKNRSPK